MSDISTGHSPQTGVREWLRRLLLRAGDVLYAGDDDLARAEGWEITVRCGGLSRTYRDPRFDLLTHRGPTAGSTARLERAP